MSRARRKNPNRLSVKEIELRLNLKREFTERALASLQAQIGLIRSVVRSECVRSDDLPVRRAT